MNYEQLRKRIEFEDGLLNSRTTIFLVTNGFWMAVIGVGGNVTVLHVGIAILGLLVSFLWSASSWQSWKVIKALSITVSKLKPPSSIEEIVQNALFAHGWKRPTDIQGRWLPLIFVGTWIIVLGWLLRSS